MSNIDRLAEQKYRAEQKAIKEANREWERSIADKHAMLRARLDTLIRRALAEFPETRADEVIPYRVKQPGFLGKKVVTRAGWAIGGVYRSESWSGPDGDRPVFLLSSGEIVWKQGREPYSLRDAALQDVFKDKDLERICEHLEGMLSA